MLKVKEVEIPSRSLDGKKLISRVVYFKDGSGYVEGTRVNDDSSETRETYTQYYSHDELDAVLGFLQ